MKQILSATVAGLMLFNSVGCIKNDSSKSREKPAASVPADESTVKNKEQEVIAQQNSQASSSHNNAQDVLGNSFVNSTVDMLMKSGKLAIKDFNGKDISMEQYKLNPNQYFVLTKIENSNTQYQVINTTSVKSSDSKIDLTYKIYAIEGKMADFKGSDLTAPKLTESLSLDLSLAALAANKSAIEAFIKRINGSAELTLNQTMFERVSNFFFPTAYASYSGKLTTMAIIFTSSAGVLYLFSLHNLGNIALAVGITFWMLVIIN